MACQGKFKLHSSDKFDEYMSALGVSFMVRKMGNQLSPVTTISEADGEWTILTATSFRSTTIKFKLGEPFDEETADGRKVKATITMEDNKLIHKQEGNKEKNEKDSVIVREFDGEEMKMILTVDDIVCTRIYKKCD